MYDKLLEDVAAVHPEIVAQVFREVTILVGARVCEGYIESTGRVGRTNISPQGYVRSLDHGFVGFAIKSGEALVTRNTHLVRKNGLACFEQREDAPARLMQPLPDHHWLFVFAPFLTPDHILRIQELVEQMS